MAFGSMLQSLKSQVPQIPGMAPQAPQVPSAAPPPPPGPSGPPQGQIPSQMAPQGPTGGPFNQMPEMIRQFILAQLGQQGIQGGGVPRGGAGGIGGGIAP